MNIINRKKQISFTLTIIIYICLMVSAVTAQSFDFSKAVQARFDSIQQALDFPGATLAFIMHDGSSFQFASGLSDVEENIKMKPADRMFTGSAGKTFVAATALQLIDEGKLHLDDKISQYFTDEPWFSRLPNHADLTIRMIMTHTGGLPRYVFKKEFIDKLNASPEKVWEPEELLAFILDEPPLHPPAQGWAYSDTDYIILGMIIEKICGNTFYKEAQKRLLTPLSLDNTLPSDKPELPGLIPGYTGDKTPPFNLPGKVLKEDGAYVINPQFEWTGGGFITNTTDLTVWAKNLYEGKMFSKEMLAEMFKACNFRTGKPDSVGYGLGVMIFPSPHGLVYGHGGIFPGYETQMLYLPAYKCAAAIQINADQFSGKLKIPPMAVLAQFIEDVKAYYESKQ